jgi:hypothetical protein
MAVMSFIFRILDCVTEHESNPSKCQDPLTHWHRVIPKKARTVKDVLLSLWQCCKLVMCSNTCTERCSMLTTQIHVDPHIQNEHNTTHGQ